TAITRTGDIFGSPLYMSPEQCQGDEVSNVSDIYSFGCLMYEVLTGKPPFEDDNPVKIVLQHLYDSPRSPGSFADRSISSSLETVMLICLAKNPQDIYQSVRQLREDLERIHQGLPIKRRLVDSSPYLVKVARGLLFYVVVSTTIFAAVLGVVLVQDYSWLVNLSRVNSQSYLEEKEKVRLAAELVQVAGRHNKPFAMLKLAEVYYQAGARDKAEATLNRALSILTERGDQSQNRQPFLRLKMAIALDCGNLSAADRLYKELLKLAGDSRLNREGVKGIGVFRGFYLPSPVVNSIDVVNDYADACMARGFLKRAGELYSKVVSLSIEKGDSISCFEAFRNTADLYRRLGKKGKARDIRKKAYGLLDRAHLKQMRLPLQELGDDCMAAQDFEAALSIYRKLVSMPEEDRSAKVLDMLRLAYCLTLSGDVDGAVAIYQELYRSQSSSYDTTEGRRLLRAYANFEIGQKKFSRAESILDQLLDIYSRDGNFMRMATVSIKRAICVAGLGEG
ncbi:MAG TPA: protein kinase, partial [Candidatus Melainabacteria bacterium]|nr:protein kinase [Candidatus Melainabacteria bacterium]